MPPAIYLWTLARSVVLAGIACALAEAWVRAVQRTPPRQQRWSLALWIVSLTIPDLVVADAYGTGLVARGWTAEAYAASLLLLKLLPTAALIGWCWPATDPSAGYLLELARPRAQRGVMARRLRWRLWLTDQGGARRLLTTLLITLLAFQDFELVALTRAEGWTDWLYIAQAGGLPLGDSLWALVGPLVIQLLILSAATWCWRWTASPSRADDAPPQGSLANWEVWFALGLAPVVGLGRIVWPLARLGWRAGDGLLVLAERGSVAGWLADELGASAGCSLVGTLLAALLLQHVAARPLWRLALLLPGLCGSLVLALLLVAGCEWSWLAWIRATPVPWIVGLTLWLAPRLWLAQAWVARQQDSAAVHAALLLSGSPVPAVRQRARALLWSEHWQPQLWTLFVVWNAGITELTLASLLAPAQVTPGIVRLYNFLHYGQSAALAGELLVLMAAPWVLALLLLAVVRGLWWLGADPWRRSSSV